jgi:hypothetical protein
VIAHLWNDYCKLLNEKISTGFVALLNNVEVKHWTNWDLKDTAAEECFSPTLT